jgi:DNA (cytosine-5)-methyltransferase 1
MKFVSLFSGAGGLDLGFEAAGWDCLYASDIDANAVETLELNKGRRFHGTPALSHAYIERADVRESSGRDILAKAGIRRGDAYAVVGGPPCQSWSSAGYQLGFEDPRGRLFRDYIRIADELDVRWLVFENVRGLLTARGPDGKPGSALQHIRETLLHAGFQTRVELLNAADYGVAQRRVRLIMIGFRVGDAPPIPRPTHTKTPDLADQGLLPWASLRECLRPLTPPTGDEIIRPNARLEAELSGLCPGTGVRSPGKSEATRPGGHWGYKQGAFVADLDLPARTVTASAQQDWIKDPKLGLRRLCPRECAAIQSFPSQWDFCGNRTEQYRQIGNAVPPVLAKAVAQSLRDHVAAMPKNRSIERPMELLPLHDRLESAIKYTHREELRNGPSRRLAPSKRRPLVVV